MALTEEVLPMQSTLIIAEKHYSEIEAAEHALSKTEAELSSSL